MTPLTNHLIILPHPAKKSISSGLLCVSSKVQVHTAKVLQVSADMEDCPVKQGDDIAYIIGKQKDIDGNIILNMEMALAVL